MKEHPILFSAPMVRAIRAGKKTQTRRVIKPQPPTQEAFSGSIFGLSRAVAEHVRMYSQNDYERLPKHPTDWELIGSVGVAKDAGFPRTYRCPYGQVGDRLWVRESWATIRDEDECSIADITQMNTMGPASLFYCDTATHITGKWRPSIHMPRWACRILLEITEIKVERVQDISDRDADAEGINIGELAKALNVRWSDFPTQRHMFEYLWDVINGKRPGCSWESNPWVWCVSFTSHALGVPTHSGVCRDELTGRVIGVVV